MEREDLVDGSASLSGEQLEGKAYVQVQCCDRIAQTLQPLGSAGCHNAFVSQGKMSYLSLLLFFKEDFSEHPIISLRILGIFFCQFLFCFPGLLCMKHDNGFHSLCSPFCSCSHEVHSEHILIGLESGTASSGEKTACTQGSLPNYPFADTSIVEGKSFCLEAILNP